MGTKHTPGPWTFFDVYVFAAPGHGRIAWLAYDKNMPAAQIEANGRIMAAGPELIAEMERCLTDKNDPCFDSPAEMGNRIRHINDILSKAIAKARGE